MRLDVSKALVAEGTGIPFSGELTLPDTSLMDETVTYPRPAQASGTYTSVGDAIHVKGMLRFVASSPCMRCLKESEHEIETELDAMFVLTPDADNPDLYVYDGAWIDLTCMAADAALMALPMQWHCREDCEGLCPVCGADRNTSPCSCRMELPDKHPFSALQQLLTKDESEV